jgi:hypothetical protein
MQETNCNVERPLDVASLPASLSEEGIVKRVSLTHTSKEICRHERLSLEIAVEWAHLGGD